MSGKSSAHAEGGRYHHGDLRNALIIASAEIIAESGSDDIALVDAARRAGVSSAAPYRHFKDREDLLRSVGELGFYALDTELRKVLAQEEPGSQACIIAMGQCYIRFVTGHGPFFRLIGAFSRVCC